MVTEQGKRGIKVGYTQKTGKVASHTREVYETKEFKMFAHKIDFTNVWYIYTKLKE